MVAQWCCRIGVHRWELWPDVLRQEAGEPAHRCSRCGHLPVMT